MFSKINVVKSGTIIQKISAARNCKKIMCRVFSVAANGML